MRPAKLCALAWRAASTSASRVSSTATSADGAATASARNAVAAAGSDVCGYAHYVTASQAGQLVASPYRQAEFNDKLVDMLTSEMRETWRENGIRFSGDADIYSMPQRAADIIVAGLDDS